MATPDQVLAVVADEDQGDARGVGVDEPGMAEVDPLVEIAVADLAAETRRRRRPSGR